jgi:4-diphosphocytidyl-2-C-methyl-D-erythritol kinase
VRRPAPAKINLALAVGPLRDDGKHEVVTVYQRVGLHDRLDVDRAPRTAVTGFDGDTIVRAALGALAREAGVSDGWRVRIEKRIPVAAGLAGGSSDAATALRLANDTLEEPLEPVPLHELAARVGADVPFFLQDGVQLGTGDGTTLTPVDVPQDFWILLVLPKSTTKPSTAAVYAAFDERDGARDFDERRARLLETLDQVRRPRDLAALPPNDLASSPLAGELHALGAFRADVSGAGPAVYALFHHREQAEAAARAFRHRGRTWITAPAWYG